MENEFDWASWIKAERLARGWSIRKVAERTGVSDTKIENLRPVLSRVEHREVNLSMRTLVLIARAFNFSPYDVFTKANVPFVYPTGRVRIDREAIGAFVTDKRKSLGLNLEELSKQIEFSLGGLFQVERSFPIKIRIDIVIELDRVLCCNGSLTGLSWVLFKNELEA